MRAFVRYSRLEFALLCSLVPLHLFSLSHLIPDGGFYMRRLSADSPSSYGNVYTAWVLDVIGLELAFVAIAV